MHGLPTMKGKMPGKDINLLWGILESVYMQNQIMGMGESSENYFFDYP